MLLLQVLLFALSSLRYHYSSSAFLKSNSKLSSDTCSFRVSAVEVVAEWTWIDVEYPTKEEHQQERNLSFFCISYRFFSTNYGSCACGGGGGSSLPVPFYHHTFIGILWLWLTRVEFGMASIFQELSPRNLFTFTKL